MISIIKARQHARYRGCFLSVRPQRINVLFKFAFCTAGLRKNKRAARSWCFSDPPYFNAKT